MKQLTKEELQGSQLGILSYIDKICKENNIKYFIHYGSMLGAVRHKGFIPWDDDIDIGMYREDYERLKAAVINDRNERYGIFDKDTCDWYFQNFMVVVDKDTVIKNHVTRLLMYLLRIWLFQFRKTMIFSSLSFMETICKSQAMKRLLIRVTF